MRLLLDLPYAEGGLARYGRGLFDALRDYPGIEVELLERPRNSLARRPFTPWGRSYVGRLARKRKVDLIHGLHMELPVGTNMVLTVPDLIPIQHPPSMPSSLKRAVFLRMVRRSAARARFVIVPSEATAQALIGIGIEASKVVEIPWGVEPTFSPVEGAGRMSARDLYANGRPYVVCVARDAPHKNLAVLPSVAEALARAGLETVLVGALDTDLVGVRSVRSLSVGVLRNLYAGAEVVLVPSLIEGFGYPALEAMACGTPVVCGPGLGALPWLRGGAVSVDVLSPEEIVAAVRDVMQDRVAMSSQASRAAGHLTIERMVRATVEVYERALA